MANIADKIAQIRQAVFGKDVRENIASGIEDINSEVEDTTTKQNNLGSQFNSLVINAGSSNAEVVAGRTSNITGQTFDTMGHRIDDHDVQLNDIAYIPAYTGVDDTNAINTLINQVPIGSRIIIPKDYIYIVNDTILINKKITIDGEGTIKAGSTFPFTTDKKNIINIQADGVEIKNITVDGNNGGVYTTIPGNGDKANNICIFDSKDVIISRVKATNSKLHGIALVGNCEGTVIEKCIVDNFIGIGIVCHWNFETLANPFKTVIRNNIIKNALQVSHSWQTFGIFSSGGDEMTIIGNKLKDTYSKVSDGGIMIYCGDNGDSADNNLIVDNIIENTITGFSVSGIRLDGLNSYTAQNNIIRGNQIISALTASVTGIRAFINAKQNIISHNQVIGGLAGILIDSTSIGCIIVENVIRDVQNTGIEVRASECKISNNRIGRPNLANGSFYGILITSSVLDFDCSFNTIIGDTTIKMPYGIYFQSNAKGRALGNIITNYLTGTTFITTSSRDIIQNFGYDSVGYNTLLLGKSTFQSSATMPSNGTWTKGDFVFNSNPVPTGSVGSQYIVLGWMRINTGSNNVLNNDWVECRTLTGN